MNAAASAMGNAFSRSSGFHSFHASAPPSAFARRRGHPSSNSRIGGNTIKIAFDIRPSSIQTDTHPIRRAEGRSACRT